MMLIECFTNSHIDNIAACLRLRPERLAMVGRIEEMHEPCERYRKLLKERGQKTNISLHDVTGMDFAEICGVMVDLVHEDDACVIDMTGGDETVTMAVGALMFGLNKEIRKRIRVEKFNHKTGMVMDCLNENRPISYKRVDLEVDQIIALHGGKTAKYDYQPPETSSYLEVEELWKLAKSDPTVWNRTITLLNEFESRGGFQLKMKLNLQEIREGILNFDRKEKDVRELLKKLHRSGVIDDHSGEDELKYTYQSPLLRYCTLKAGNILEVKTLLEGRSVLEKGAPYFRSCRMSVDIDWDGILNKNSEKSQDTHNEIDVLLIHGMTPLFVSCKNGGVDEEELYKLNTVAQRFGGPYARKMLIATDLDVKNNPSDRALIRRAKEMDIHPVTEVADMSHEEWRKVFKEAMR